MAQDRIEVGTRVSLKSGGPQMTVAEVGQDGSCWCQWFVNQKLESGSFNPQVLRVLGEGQE